MIEGINVENALRTIKSRQNLLKELMRRTESAQHQFNFSAETQQYLQTLLQELAQMIRKSEWFYRDYWFLKQEEMAERVQKQIEAFNEFVRNQAEEDQEKKKAAEANLRMMIIELISRLRELNAKAAAEIEQRRILVKQIITELNEIANKIQFTDAEVTEFNRVNNSNYSKQNLQRMETRIVKDIAQNFEEYFLNDNNSIITDNRTNDSILKEMVLRSTRKEKITSDGANWFTKTIMQRPEMVQLESQIQKNLFYQEQQAVNERIQRKTAEKKDKTAEEKGEKLEQKQEKVEQKQEKVEQEREKAVQKQRDLEIEAKTEIAAEEQEELLQTFAAKTEERSEVATEISVDEANESKIDVEETHPLKEFLDSFSSESLDRWYNDAEFKDQVWKRAVSYLKKLPSEEREKVEAEVIRNLQGQNLLGLLTNCDCVINILDTAFAEALKSTATRTDTLEIEEKSDNEIMCYFKKGLATLAEDIGWDEEQQKEITQVFEKQLNEISSSRWDDVKDQLKSTFEQASDLLDDSDPDGSREDFLRELQNDLSSLEDHPQP